MSVWKFIWWARELAIEVLLPSIGISLLMTGVVYVVNLPAPRSAQASEVTVAAEAEGFRAVEAAATSVDTIVESAGPDQPSAAAATSGRYRLRLGVFGVLSNAMQYAEELRADGYRPEVIPRKNNRDQDFYYLYVASYDSADDAARAADEIRAAGRDVYIEEGPVTEG